ncbi:uncharacterized [Tachysurus ichikawai]
MEAGQGIEETAGQGNMVEGGQCGIVEQITEDEARHSTEESIVTGVTVKKLKVCRLQIQLRVELRLLRIQRNRGITEMRTLSLNTEVVVEDTLLKTFADVDKFIASAVLLQMTVGHKVLGPHL